MTAADATCKQHEGPTAACARAGHIHVHERLHMLAHGQASQEHGRLNTTREKCQRSLLYRNVCSCSLSFTFLPAIFCRSKHVLSLQDITNLAMPGC